MPGPGRPPLLLSSPLMTGGAVLAAYALARRLSFSIPLGPSEDVLVRPAILLLGPGFLLHAFLSRGKAERPLTGSLWGRAMQSAILLTLGLLAAGTALALILGFPAGTPGLMNRLASVCLEAVLLLYFMNVIRPGATVRERRA